MKRYSPKKRKHFDCRCLIGVFVLLLVPYSALGVDLNLLAREVETQAVQLLSSRPESINSIRVEASAAGIDSRLKLTDCRVPLQYDISNYQGGKRLAVRVSCTSGKVWTLYVPVEVSIYRRVLVTATSIPRGTVLSAQMVSYMEADIAGYGGTYMDHIEQVVGLQTRKTLVSGDILRPSLLEKPRIVVRGEQVQVIAQTGAIAVKTNAKALANGRKGDKIRVQNTDSKKVFEAFITAPGQVEVHL